MARLTAAEKKVAQEAIRLEQEARRQAEFDAEKAAWPQRVMKNLERATREGMEMSVQEGMFVVTGYDQYNDHNTFWFGLVPAPMAKHWSKSHDFNQMDALERFLVDREQERAEQERIVALRKSAMSKLTAEEREALGI